MNVVVLVGRLTKDPILRTTSTGKSVTNFTLAVDRRYKSQDQPTADFINIIAWNRQAELISQYLKKGRQIAVQGRIQTGSYQAQDGTMRYTTDVVLESFDFLGSKNDTGFADTGQSFHNNQPPADDDIIPLELDDDFSLLNEDDDVPF